MSTKKQFMNRPRIRNLSPKEKERRWQQHVMSVQGTKTQARRGYTRNTRIIQKRVGKKVAAELLLSLCAQEYLVAQHSPFSLKVPACVPDLHAVPSKKVRVKTRGTFSTGLDGNGYIYLNSWENSNTGPAVGFSTAASASSSSFLPIGSGNSGSLSQSKLPYTDLEFKLAGNSPAVSARTVGVGLRIRYIGAELARSGQITGIRHPDNSTLANVTFDTARSFSTAKTFHNRRQWIYVIWRPVEPNEYEFTTSPSHPADQTEVPFNLGFCLNGTTSSSGSPGPAPFEFEIIRFVEYIGNIDNISPTHVDLVGMSHVRNSIPTKSTTQNPHKSLVHAIKSIEQHLPEELGAAGLGAMAYKKFAGTETAASDSAPGVLTEVTSGVENFFSGIGSKLSQVLPEAETLGGEALEFAPLLI